MVKVLIFVMGWVMLIPTMFLCSAGNFLYFVLGAIYFVVIVFSGPEIDRKFWKAWWSINKSLFPLPKEYDI